jgi:hypothetical protein
MKQSKEQPGTAFSNLEQQGTGAESSVKRNVVELAS